MNDKTHPDRSDHSKLMHYGMMACCAVMLLPIAGFFIAGGSIGGLWSNSAAFLPLLICVGAHFVMHKVMRKSCHGAPEHEKRMKANPLLTAQRTEKPKSQRL